MGHWWIFWTGFFAVMLIGVLADIWAAPVNRIMTGVEKKACGRNH